jgi:formylmethanofuran dehydrogenase subunit C
MRVLLQAKQRKKPNIPIEAESITPGHFLDGTDIALYEGNKERNLRDLFTVSVDGEAACADEVEVVLIGDTSRVKRIGEYMNGGRIVVEGSIGMHCGNFMSAGTIEIHGDADGWLARELRGGTVICHGSAGHYCASGYRGEKHGMKGGTVVVDGNAGDFAAEYLKGGSVTIHGNAGDMPGVEMAGGELTIDGDCSRPCGNMKGGTCTISGTVSGMLPTFRKTGTAVLGAGKIPYVRFEGDIANRGKGTLFIRNYQYMD